MCLNLCLFCFFYCHVWKLIIQCPNISCHLSCDKINNSSNRNQTNATFLCWMRNMLCCICGAEFGEIRHFISNEIIFYQLIYHFIIFTLFEIISKEGFCAATPVLFFTTCFFPDEKSSGLKKQGTFSHFCALSSWSYISSFSRGSTHCTCSALAKFQPG